MIGFRATGPGLLVALLMTPVPQVASQTKGSAEEKLLGAPCRGRYQLSPQTRAAQRAIHRKHDAAMKQRDYETAVAMRKELIRYQCHNHFLWFYLAELYVELGQNGDAITVLDYLYEKMDNEVDRRLRTEGNALHPLAQSQEFQRSALAGKLSQARALLDERKQEYRKKLEALPKGKSRPATTSPRTPAHLNAARFGAGTFTPTPSSVTSRRARRWLRVSGRERRSKG